MSDAPKTIIANTDQILELATRLAAELTAVLNSKIEHLEKRIEMLEQELETAYSRIRELETALAAAFSSI
jgi:chaperonin cofactor prefoldin